MKWILILSLAAHFAWASNLASSPFVYWNAEKGEALLGGGDFGSKPFPIMRDGKMVFPEGPEKTAQILWKFIEYHFGPKAKVECPCTPKAGPGSENAK